MNHPSCGILLHLTSLPSPYGIGTLGQAAYDFVDFLRDAGQSCWQVLPIGPTGYGDSPYQSFSTFAGNPYLIDLDVLIQDGLLAQAEVDAVNWGERPDQVDFALLYQQRLPVLRGSEWLRRRILGRSVTPNLTGWRTTPCLWR